MENIHKSPIYQINPDCMVLGVLSDHLAFSYMYVFYRIISLRFSHG